MIVNFSSWGMVMVDSSNWLKFNIVVLGVGICFSIRNGGFVIFLGISMVGLYVVGVVVLLIFVNFELAGQVEVIEDLLESIVCFMFSDQDCGGVFGMEVFNVVYGYGWMNILVVVQEMVSIFSREMLIMVLIL